MGNYWNQPGVPHKGWHTVDVIDAREDGRSIEDTDYETCMVCNNERIRYVHILEHNDIDNQFRVGCICAEKMTNDYHTPGQRENNLRNKAIRKSKWLNRNWNYSAHGNLYSTKDGHALLIFLDKKSGKYKCKLWTTGVINPTAILMRQKSLFLMALNTLRNRVNDNNLLFIFLFSK